MYRVFRSSDVSIGDLFDEVSHLKYIVEKNGNSPYLLTHLVVIDTKIDDMLRRVLPEDVLDPIAIEWEAYRLFPQHEAAERVLTLIDMARNAIQLLPSIVASN